MKDNLINLTNILNDIKHKKLVFFVGAGIDFNSGIPLVKGKNGLMTKILSKLPMKKEEIDMVLQNEHFPFELFMNILKNHSDIYSLLEVFEIGEINANHRFLSKLAKNKLISLIITTNFTQLIEKSFEEEGLIKDEDFEIISKEDELLNWVPKSNIISIVKIHGCINDKSDVVITIDKIARKQSLKSRSNIIRTLLNDTKYNSILMLGYSCSDVFDIMPMIRSNLNYEKKIFFVNHSSNDLQSNNMSNKMDFLNYINGYYFNYNTDSLIDFFNEKLNVKKEINNYDEIINRNNDKVSEIIDNWFINVERNGIEKKYYICGEILSSISLKKEAVYYYEEILRNIDNDLVKSKTMYYLSKLYFVLNFKLALRNSEGGLVLAKKCDDNLLKLKHYINLGNYNVDNLEQALYYFDCAYKLCKTNNDEAQLFMNKGILFKNNKKYKEAIVCFTKALRIFIKLGDIINQGWCYGNIGNIYQEDENNKNFFKSEKCYKKALEIAQNTGNQLNISAWTGNLGLLYGINEKYEISKEYLHNALTVSKEIGDINGIGIWLANLSDVYSKQGNYIESIKYMEESVKIADILGKSVLKKNRLIKLNNIQRK